MKEQDNSNLYVNSEKEEEQEECLDESSSSTKIENCIQIQNNNNLEEVDATVIVDDDFFIDFSDTKAINELIILNKKQSALINKLLRESDIVLENAACDTLAMRESVTAANVNIRESCQEVSQSLEKVSNNSVFGGKVFTFFKDNYIKLIITSVGFLLVKSVATYVFHSYGIDTFIITTLSNYIPNISIGPFTNTSIPNNLSNIHMPKLEVPSSTNVSKDMIISSSSSIIFLSGKLIKSIFVFIINRLSEK